MKTSAAISCYYSSGQTVCDLFARNVPISLISNDKYPRPSEATEGVHMAGVDLGKHLLCNKLVANVCVNK